MAMVEQEEQQAENGSKEEPLPCPTQFSLYKCICIPGARQWTSRILEDSMTDTDCTICTNAEDTVVCIVSFGLEFHIEPSFALCDGVTRLETTPVFSLELWRESHWTVIGRVNFHRDGSKQEAQHVPGMAPDPGLGSSPPEDLEDMGLRLWHPAGRKEQVAPLFECFRFWALWSRMLCSFCGGGDGDPFPWSDELEAPHPIRKTELVSVWKNVSSAQNLHEEVFSKSWCRLLWWKQNPVKHSVVYPYLLVSPLIHS